MSHEKPDYSFYTENNHNKFKIYLNHHGDATIHMNIIFSGKYSVGIKLMIDVEKKKINRIKI